MLAAWANVVVTLLLSGFIWTIQVLHYPLFAAVGDDSVRRLRVACTRSGSRG